jgi:hypothetical protein
MHLVYVKKISIPYHSEVQPGDDQQQIQYIVSLEYNSFLKTLKLIKLRIIFHDISVNVVKSLQKLISIL